MTRIERTLNYMGAYIFGRRFLAKTKKNKAIIEIEVQTMLHTARVLTNNNDLTVDDLIDIGINHNDYTGYLKEE